MEDTTEDSTPEKQRPEGQPSEQPSSVARRDILRVATGLGLGHMTILSMGSPASASPARPIAQCGTYDASGNLVLDDLDSGGDCGLGGIGKGAKLYAKDEDCGSSMKMDGSGGYSQDNDCGKSTEGGAHSDSDCTVAGLVAPNGGKHTDQDCEKLIPFTDPVQYYEDDDCSWSVGGDGTPE